MNEEQKNIETCLAENILSEVASVPTDPQFRSLTDEALDPFKQQALQQAGYDGYEKVVWTHKPYTFTSRVKQMKSNLILLLRRLWRYPFGRGTTVSSDAGSSSASDAGSSSASAAAPIRSLADMWQHYITRLKGNPEYGIPSRLSQLTDLPSAPALLSDRKIGGADVADGMSILHILCNTTLSAGITELTDDNVGWTYNIEQTYYDSNKLRTAFPAMKKLTLNCKEVNVGSNYMFVKDNIIEEIYLTGAEKIVGYLAAECPNIKSPFVCPTLKDVQNSRPWNNSYFKKIECVNLESGFTGYDYSMIVRNNPELEEVILPKVPSYDGRNSTHSSAFGGCPKLRRIDMRGCSYVRASNRPNSVLEGFLGDSYNVEELILGTLTNATNLFVSMNQTTKLLHLEFGDGTAISLNLQYWSPALDDSNLQQFLSNFKTYIAERLTDKGTGLTLTLSQEVRNAIHAAEDEYGIENIIITKKGWTISPAPN